MWLDIHRPLYQKLGQEARQTQTPKLEVGSGHLSDLFTRGGSGDHSQTLIPEVRSGDHSQIHIPEVGLGEQTNTDPYTHTAVKVLLCATPATTQDLRFESQIHKTRNSHF
jgi:hypothetical protein